MHDEGLKNNTFFEKIYIPEMNCRKKCLPSTVVPDSSLTLNTLSIPADTGTSMALKTLPTMAHPSFTKEEKMKLTID